MHLEESILLSELIQLRISVKQASGDKLVEDTHRKRWKDSEEDVVEREGPGFVDYFARESILEDVLNRLALTSKINRSPTQNCVMYSVIFL